MMNRVPTIANASGSPRPRGIFCVTSKAPVEVRFAGRAGVLFLVTRDASISESFHGQRESAARALAGESRGRARLDVAGPRG